MSALHDKPAAERLALAWHWLATFVSFALLTFAAAGFVIAEPLAHVGGLIGAIFYCVTLSCLAIAVVELFAVVWHIFSIREHTNRLKELNSDDH